MQKMLSHAAAWLSRQLVGVPSATSCCLAASQHCQVQTFSCVDLAGRSNVPASFFVNLPLNPCATSSKNSRSRETIPLSMCALPPFHLTNLTPTPVALSMFLPQVLPASQASPPRCAPPPWPFSFDFIRHDAPARTQDPSNSRVVLLMPWSHGAVPEVRALRAPAQPPPLPPWAALVHGIPLFPANCLHSSAGISPCYSSQAVLQFFSPVSRASLSLYWFSHPP